ADQVLHRAARAERDVDARRDRAAGETDLVLLRQPAGIGDVARGGDRRAEARRSVPDGRQTAGAADALPDAEYEASAVERGSRVGEGVPTERRHAGRE